MKQSILKMKHRIKINRFFTKTKQDKTNLTLFDDTFCYEKRKTLYYCRTITLRPRTI